MAKQRKANFELLRIVLMSMILFWHFIAHGVLHLSDNPVFAETNPSLIHLLVYPLRCYAVNCFILLSGYFGVKVNKERFLSFSVQLLFYTILSFGIYLLLPEGKDALSTLSLNSIKYIYPSTDAGCWFVTAYVMIMLLSPILNAGAEKISKSTFAWMLVVLLGVFLSGYHYYTSSLPESHIFMITIYMLGRYMRLHGMEFVEKHCWWIWLAAIAILAGHTAYMHLSGTLTCENFLRESLRYNPFNIIAAVAFFYIFKRIDIGTSNIINWLAAGVFAAYLLTDGYTRAFWNENVVNIFGDNVIILFFVAIAAVLLFSCFDHLRKTCQKPIDAALCKVMKKFMN